MAKIENKLSSQGLEVIEAYCRISGLPREEAERRDRGQVLTEVLEYFTGKRTSQIDHDDAKALVKVAFSHERPALTPSQLAVFGGLAMMRSDVFEAYDGAAMLDALDPDAAWVCAYARLGYPDRAAREFGFWQLAALSGCDFTLALYRSNGQLQESLGPGVERHIQAESYPAQGEIAPDERLISAGSLLAHAMDQALDAETRIQAVRGLTELGFARLLPALKEVLQLEKGTNDLEVAASI